jgi:2-oxo-hept-3-ene-1,7-dioate hydratase
MLIISPHPFSYRLAPSFIRPIETRKGDTIQADYGSYGTVSFYFA